MNKKKKSCIIDAIIPEEYEVFIPQNVWLVYGREESTCCDPCL